MQKFKFICEQWEYEPYWGESPGPKKITTVESEQAGLYDVLQDFANFLRACGYSLPLCDEPLILNEDVTEENA
jgi:hypothetical protein